jgi:hypothetical protein
VNHSTDADASPDAGYPLAIWTIVLLFVLATAAVAAASAMPSR